MSLFQNIVVKKYLGACSDRISAAYSLYAKYFLNSEIQENIRNSKEEQFQEGFLRELLVKVLGYTLYPDPDYNLITEQKNENDSKKADGAIIINGEVKAVIELKDHKITDLKQIEAQAFGYKNNHRKATYVVTSNFEKLRFYIENAIDFEEFNLFNLTEEKFAVLWICLAYENLLKDLPKQLKNESANSEDQITKKLYKDYSTFKRALFDNIQKNNPAFDKLELFRKTQKLLDRFLFVFFAEDKGLLPPNSMRRIIDQWDRRNDDPLNEYQPLYERFRLYFKYMNEGHKGKSEDIFGYNGGLFKPDEMLNTIAIDDDVLNENILKLIAYNFDTEVDVNILGHVFEHSLTEIEEITNAIEGKAQDAKTSKRKKDGVFYTPRYITAYIVENTLGKLCTDKKTALAICESEYVIDKKRPKAQTKILLDKLNAYREWLLSLTICDPACGSGAFLNAALDFLIAEHSYIDELIQKIFGGLPLQNIENTILENNLYGVDINEEGVAIAKLSLWLRTAKWHRKLNSLNNNIKCGNSLISDPEVAGEKAFDWHKEFPQVFEKGGFDVVIGNPPYVDNRNFDKEILKYYSQNYIHSFTKSGTGKYNTTKLNLIALFIELTFNLLKENGLSSYIFHKNIFKTNAYTSIRKFILDKYDILLLTDWGAGQFQDVVAETATFVIKKGNIQEDKIKVDFFTLNDKYLENYQNQSSFNLASEFIFGIYSNEFDRKLLDKIEYKTEYLEKFVSVNNGIVTGDDKKYLFTEKISENHKKVVRGKNIKRYNKLFANEYVDYQKEQLLRARDENIFLATEKLIMQMININFIVTYDNEQFYNLGTTYSITNKLSSCINLKYILLLLNSKLMQFYYLKKFTNESALTNAISTQNLFKLPIKEISISDQQPFIILADKMLSLNSELQTKRQRFLKRVSDNFAGIKITGKIETFDELEFSQFVAELAKQKIALTLKQQDEWEEYFNEYKTECRNFVNQINTTDKEIDALVYALYGLSEEEVRIIEK